MIYWLNKRDSHSSEEKILKFSLASFAMITLLRYNRFKNVKQIFQKSNKMKANKLIQKERKANNWILINDKIDIQSHINNTIIEKIKDLRNARIQNCICNLNLSSFCRCIIMKHLIKINVKGNH